jgi:tRNA threonylcarbamoyladenosine biosynthesis protein TsaE
MATYISHSLEETLALGERWGREAAPGWLIAISGDLGSGKTQLVRGIARGLGVTERVHSPTFTIVNYYSSGRVPLWHLDLYRLETPEAMRSAGLDEYFKPEGVAAVEWAERWLPVDLAGRVVDAGGAARVRRVSIQVIDEQVRKIEYEDSGA